MQPITLHRRFRPWRYGIGHSQLLLHARADGGHNEHLNVLFEGVLAVKLRSAYHPLILQPADQHAGASIVAFAQIPARRSGPNPLRDPANPRHRTWICRVRTRHRPGHDRHRARRRRHLEGLLPRAPRPQTIFELNRATVSRAALTLGQPRPLLVRRRAVAAGLRAWLRRPAAHARLKFEDPF